MNSCHSCDIIFGPGWFCATAGEEALWWVEGGIMQNTAGLEGGI